MATSEAEQQCPFCQEWIPASAQRCRFCQRVLSRPEAPEAYPPRPRSAAYPEEVEPPPRRPDYRSERPRRYVEDDYDDEPGPRRRRRSGRGPYAPCPQCGCPGFAERVSFTWWGGFLGPALITHVRCKECGRCYNGRTGGYNTAGIAIYTIVCVVICLVLFALFLVASIK